MASLDFSVEHHYSAGPDDHTAEIQIRMFPTEGIPIAVTAILDTGASISIFDKSLLPLLGITDVTAGPEFEVMTANSARAKAYAHEVEIEFLGRRMRVLIGFCPAWPDGTPNLLGMKSFFEQLHVAFKHRERLALVAFP